MKKQFDLQETFNKSCAAADLAFTYRFVGRDREAAIHSAKAKRLALRCADALPDDHPSKIMALHAAAMHSHNANDSADALRLIGVAKRLTMTQRDVEEIGRLEREIALSISG